MSVFFCHILSYTYTYTIKMLRIQRQFVIKPELCKIKKNECYNKIMNLLTYLLVPKLTLAAGLQEMN